MGGGRRRASAACAQRAGERARDCRLAGGAREAGKQRTLNMAYMLLTPEMSQLRGWLKARAFCRGSQAGHTVRGGLRAAERWEAASDRGVYTQRAGETVQLCRYRGVGCGSSALET